MSLNKSFDENVGRRNYRWPKAKQRIISLDDQAILAEAQHLKIREDMGEDLSDRDRLFIKMAARIERRHRINEHMRKKENSKKFDD